MSNMSYCMFENTFGELKDCEEKLEEINWDFEQLSESEQYYARKLMKVCKRLNSVMEMG